MLICLRRLGNALSLLALAACSPAPPVVEPVAVEAGYRLLFNETLVGNALFTLEIQPGGGYRIEAFTVPGGQIPQTDGHEVLETSHGKIDAGGIWPQRFEHSVLQGERIEMVSFVFDWDRGILQLIGKGSERKVALLPGTHDRLSYLLAAHRLAAAGEGALQVQIASPDAAGEARLEVMGTQAVVVPLGRYTAVGIRRVAGDPDEVRALWFDTGLSPLPVRIVHIHDGNTVEMQLESLNRSPSRPR